MADYSKIAVELSLQNQEYLKKITESLNATKKFSGVAESLINKLAAPALALVSFETLKNKLTDCAERAMAYEDAQARLTNTLKETGYVAGFTTKGLTDLASQFSKTSKFGTTALIEMETVLLRSENLRGEVFKNTAQAVVDIAAAKKEDLIGIATALGRAMENPTNAARALRAVNIQLTDSEQQQINAFMGGNRVIEAQNIILQRLKIYQGAAAAEIETTSGKLRMLEKQSEETSRKIGTVLLPAIVTLAQGLKDAGIKFAGTAAIIALGPLIPLLKKYADARKEAADKEAAVIEEIEKKRVAENKNQQMRLYNEQQWMEKRKQALMEMDAYIASRQKDDLDAQLQKEENFYQKQIDLANQSSISREEQFRRIEKLTEAHEQAVSTITNKYIMERVDRAMSFANQYESQLMSMYQNVVQIFNQLAQNKIDKIQRHSEVYNQVLEAQKRSEIEAVQASTASEEEKNKKIAAINKKYGEQEYKIQLALAIMRYKAQKAAFEANQKFQAASIIVQTQSAIANAAGAAFSTQSSGGNWQTGLALAIVSTVLLNANMALQLALLQSQKAPAFQPPSPPSYDRGAWEIPQNQYAQVHQGEMIVPKPFAQTIRENIINGTQIILPIYIGDKHIDTIVYDSLSRTAKRIGAKVFGQ